MSTLILNCIWIYRYFGFTEKTKIKVVNICVFDSGNDYGNIFMIVSMQEIIYY